MHSYILFLDLSTAELDFKEAIAAVIPFEQALSFDILRGGGGGELREIHGRKAS